MIFYLHLYLLLKFKLQIWIRSSCMNSLSIKINKIFYYIHNTLIKQKRKFGSLFADDTLNWGDDNNRNEPTQKYLFPMLGSRDSKTKLKNHRRMHIGMCNLYI